MDLKRFSDSFSNPTDDKKFEKLKARIRSIHKLKDGEVDSLARKLSHVNIDRSLYYKVPTIVNEIINFEINPSDLDPNKLSVYLNGGYDSIRDSLNRANP